MPSATAQALYTLVWHSQYMFVRSYRYPWRYVFYIQQVHVWFPLHQYYFLFTYLFPGGAGQYQRENVLHYFDFWFVCSNFFYSLGAFVIVVAYLDVDLTLNGDLWGIHSIVLFTSSFLTLYGYIAMRRNT